MVSLLLLLAWKPRRGGGGGGRGAGQAAGGGLGAETLIGLLPVRARGSAAPRVSWTERVSEVQCHPQLVALDLRPVPEVGSKQLPGLLDDILLVLHV